MEGHFVQAMIDSTGSELIEHSCLVKIKNLRCNGVKGLQLYKHMLILPPLLICCNTLWYITQMVCEHPRTLQSTDKFRAH